jgi:hypothetical protein
MHFRVIGDARQCQVDDPIAERIVSILNGGAMAFFSFRGGQLRNRPDSPAAPGPKTWTECRTSGAMTLRQRNQGSTCDTGPSPRRHLFFIRGCYRQQKEEHNNE